MALDAKVLTCKEMTITANGLPGGTIVLIDGQKLNKILSVFFESDMQDRHVVATIEQVDENDNTLLAVVKFVATEEKRI